MAMRFKVTMILCWMILGIATPSAEKRSPEDTSEKITIRDFSDYFHGYNGCFVLYDDKASTYTIFNREKSFEPASPCSTFKIVNSLIGLETEIVKNENTVFAWDGTNYPYAEWNRDLTMAEAIRLSAYWYYQRIAGAVGPERMQHFLDALDFGNRDISGGITQFWQQSSLRISPKAWIDVLRKIHSYDVPFSRRNIDIVKKIIQLDERNGATLYGKTGSGTKEPGFAAIGPGATIVSGWFVGFLETGQGTFFFATHINAESNATGAMAKEITLRLLDKLRIFQRVEGR
jgi:bla regulator protein BlaR1